MTLSTMNPLHHRLIAVQVEDSQGRHMKVMSKEKSEVLPQEKGWSLERADGYVLGEKYRWRGLELPVYLRVGIDKYAQAARAGYYKRDDLVSTANLHPIS